MSGTLDWDLLQSLHAVLEAGSFSAAARLRRLTQPTLGRHIDQLERQLGAPLFLRSPRGLQPTDLAESFRPHLADSHVIACDERGKARASRAFAEEIGVLRDRGVRRLVFLIGGADGLDPDLVKTCAGALAFGPQTWPHAMARAMLCEQIYRAVSILAGSPYHRD